MPDTNKGKWRHVDTAALDSVISCWPGHKVKMYFDGRKHYRGFRVGYTGLIDDENSDLD